MKEALLYERLDDKTVHCYLCSHNCNIHDKGFGVCGVRENVNGLLYTHSYGRLVAANVDPIEKKPLYHFLPGSLSFSIATMGCNFRCGFCQNWQISQRSYKSESDSLDRFVSPGEVIKEAKKHNCKSISYTYTEPTIFFEYALDTAKLAKKNGLYNIFVTNGYMTKEALLSIREYLDAANVDLKFFNDSSYKNICQARLEPVLNSIRLMRDLGIWVEITTLIIPGENDSEKELGDIAQFILSVDKDIPWHVSGFHPDYRFDKHRSTPEETLKKAQSIGYGAGLRYVYAGNVSGWGNNTLCYKCQKNLIKRKGFSILEYNIIEEGECVFCKAHIKGVFS